MTNLSKRIFTSLVVITFLLLSFKNFILINIFLLLIIFFSLKEFNLIFKKIFIKNNFKYFISVLISVIYIFFFSLSIWNYLNTFNYNSKICFMFLILICICTDIGGFIFGKIIGGKNFTKISPNKTYSGIIGSFAVPLIFGYLYNVIYSEILVLKINIFLLIIFISFISQFGDLMISFLKRKAKIKDTGFILPGHGGILDRIDGMLLALPIGVIFI